MKKWVLKAVVQKTISYLPGGQSINYLFQKYVTKGIYLTDEYFFDRLGHAKTHIESYTTLCTKPLNDTLEIGTGWYPVVPISLFLSGAGNINTIDITELLTKKSFSIAIKRFLEDESRGALAPYLKIVPECLAALKKVDADYETMSFEQVLSALHITYLLKDARNSGLADKSMDLVSSNNTFEHIYPEILEGILKEFKRLVKPGGVMSHAIDMSDHFAHFDKTINHFNFLKYSDAEWKMIDNSIQPQNRLRVSDFRAMYKKLGIPITIEKVTMGNLQALGSMKLNSKYDSLAANDVGAIQCYFASLIA
jgi:SAM-dependent methyltransferase